MAVFTFHHPIVFAFGIMGNFVSFMVYLAPAPTFYRILKKKTTGGFQSVPYVIALLSSMLWMYYALAKSNEIFLITINSFGCFIEAIYLTIFIIYAPKKSRMFTLKLLVLLNIIGFGLIILGTQYLVKARCRVQVIGWISVVLSASVYVAPLSIMKQVIQTKSVEFMPISLSFALILSAVMWFSYGLLLKDYYIAVPNVVGLIFGLVQITLYLVYKNYNTDEKEKLPTTVKPKTLATSEIYPVFSETDISIVEDRNQTVEVIIIEHENNRRLSKVEDEGNMVVANVPN